MARAYSQNLRNRVIDAALGGCWLAMLRAVWDRRSDGDRVGAAGAPRADTQGIQTGLSAETDQDDAGLDHLRALEPLLAERGVKATRAALSTFLDRAVLYKKTAHASEQNGETS